MSDSYGESIGVFVLLVVIVGGILMIGAAIGSGIDSRRGYRSGQVDALHGVFKYEILTDSDGTEHVVEKARTK